MTAINNDLWPQQIEKFIGYLDTVRKLSPHTLSSYRRDLDKFATHCLQTGIENPSVAHTADVRRWAAQMHRQGLSGPTVQRALSSLRSFYNHCNHQGSNDHNPALGVQAPKSAKKLPKTMDADSVAQLLAIEADDELSIRDRAILELFYSSGLRLSELVNLDLEDLDMRGAMVTVTGKGRKTRILPVGRFAIEALQKWLHIRQNFLPQADDSTHLDGPVFLSKRGRRLAQRSVQSRLQKYSLQQDVGQKVHPHMLRHSFASHMLESSGDLRAVQELLGHANISTTQIYTHLDFQHLAKVYDQAHPRAMRKSSVKKKSEKLSD